MLFKSLRNNLFNVYILSQASHVNAFIKISFFCKFQKVPSPKMRTKILFFY